MKKPHYWVFFIIILFLLKNSYAFEEKLEINIFGKANLIGDRHVLFEDGNLEVMLSCQNKRGNIYFVVIKPTHKRGTMVFFSKEEILNKIEKEKKKYNKKVKLELGEDEIVLFIYFNDKKGVLFSSEKKLCFPFGVWLLRDIYCKKLIKKVISLSKSQFDESHFEIRGNMVVYKDLYDAIRDNKGNIGFIAFTSFLYEKPELKVEKEGIKITYKKRLFLARQKFLKMLKERKAKKEKKIMLEKPELKTNAKVVWNNIYKFDNCVEIETDDYFFVCDSLKDFNFENPGCEKKEGTSVICRDKDFFIYIKPKEKLKVNRFFEDGDFSFSLDGEILKEFEFDNMFLLDNFLLVFRKEGIEINKKAKFLYFLNILGEKGPRIYVFSKNEKDAKTYEEVLKKIKNINTFSFFKIRYNKENKLLEEFINTINKSIQEYYSFINDKTIGYPIDEKYNVISSLFGLRKDPKLRIGGSKIHLGIDIMCPRLSTIYAPCNGIIVAKGRTFFSVISPSGIGCSFFHSKTNLPLGYFVYSGEKIGKTISGHLHFEIFVNGEKEEIKEFIEKNKNLVYFSERDYYTKEGKYKMGIAAISEKRTEELCNKKGLLLGEKFRYLAINPVCFLEKSNRELVFYKYGTLINPVLTYFYGIKTRNELKDAYISYAKRGCELYSFIST